MKPRIIYIRPLLFIVIMILCFQHDIFSQGTDIRFSNQKHFYLGFSFSPAQTSILDNGSSSIAQVKSEKKNSFFGSFEIGYSFSRVIGISTGIGYSSYVTDLSLASYTNAYDTTDSENEQYNRRISGKDIIETQKISFLYIPLSLNLQIPFSESFGLYLQAGINFSKPMQKNYNSTGTFSYSGYYPEYNVLIEKVSYEGFLSENKNSVSGELITKSLYQELFSSAGFQFTIHNSVQISLGVFYNKLLSDLSDNPSTATFQLSSIPNQMKSMMLGSTKATAQSMGLKIVLRFYL